jgi:hypothetical protein
VLIKRINDFKKAFADLLHKPGHVKGRDIGPSGGGDDDFIGGFHLGYILGTQGQRGIMVILRKGFYFNFIWTRICTDKHGGF